MRRKPLAGRRIVITRRAEQAGSLHRALKSRGAEVIVLPTIELAPPKSWRPVDAAIQRVREYDWIIFTSVNGVEAFAARLRKKGKTMSALKGALIAAIGPATARALRVRGLRVRVVPEEFRAEGLVQALQRVQWRGKRVLLARAAKARQVLPQELRRRGASVDVIAVYRTIVPTANRSRVARLFGARKPDAITFTSSSTVRNFCAMAGTKQAQRTLHGVTVATIGPVTSRTARALGLKVGVEAKSYTVPGLVKALANHFTK
ncbi:MAG TPA: uroporphyrinogen-III synthase [Candidatus Xenobia bacterium]|nr:uroporphyrinogen-III synthase [Candidatus Xenobia bacterium]